MQPPSQINEPVATCQCTNCHGHLEFDAVHAGQAVACPHCGANTVLYLPQVAKIAVRALPPPVAPALPPVLATSAEHDVDQVFYSNGPVVVTKTRFVSFAETFVISNIASVYVGRFSPPYAGPIFLTVVGLLLCLWNVWVGVAVTTPGVVWTIFLKPSFAVMITTSGGEERHAVQSKDRKLIHSVVAAINQAIIARG